MYNALLISPQTFVPFLLVSFIKTLLQMFMYTFSFELLLSYTPIMCVCTRACKHVHMHAYLWKCMCVEARDQPWDPVTLFLNIGSLIDLELTVGQAAWPVLIRDLPVYASSSLGF